MTVSKFKTNQDLLSAQQKEFTRSGVILKNIFSITPKHPVLSILFAIAFGVAVNAIYDLIAYFVIEGEVTTENTLAYLGVILALFLICAGVIARLRKLHKDLFVDTPLNQKKVLVTLVSKGRTNFMDTPSYNTFRSLLYSDSGHATVNALDKVILVTTELPEVEATARSLKDYIAQGDRSADLYGVTINAKTLMEIERQMDFMLSKLLESYTPHEIVVDYTGGTKDMSIALLRASEKALVLPIYLNAATDGQHSKY